VRLAALDLEGDLRGGSGGSWAGSWDSRIFRVSLKFMCFSLSA